MSNTQTFLEYVTVVKGIEYLIVAAFCLLFIAFWLLWKYKDNKTRIAFLVVLALISSAGAIIIINSSHNIIPKDVKDLTISQNYFIVNGSVEFHQTMINRVSCNKCHHNSGEIRPCQDCHKPFDPSIDKPNFKAAVHTRCLSCHTEIKGPENCITCHRSASYSNYTVPTHKLIWENCNKCHTGNNIKSINSSANIKIVYHDNCLKCHSKGIGGALKLPDDHTGREGNTCKGCHKSMS